MLFAFGPGGAGNNNFDFADFSRWLAAPGRAPFVIWCSLVLDLGGAGGIEIFDCKQFNRAW